MAAKSQAHLEDLPDELLVMICDELADHPGTLAAFARTSGRVSQVSIAVLYRSITIYRTSNESNDIELSSMRPEPIPQYKVVKKRVFKLCRTYHKYPERRELLR